MGSVVGTHGKSRQVADISPGNLQKRFLLRRRISGEYNTFKKRLRNIVDFHTFLLSRFANIFRLSMLLTNEQANRPVPNGPGGICSTYFFLNIDCLAP